MTSVSPTLAGSTPVPGLLAVANIGVRYVIDPLAIVAKSETLDA
jgi:hypothetical protein